MFDFLISLLSFCLCGPLLCYLLSKFNGISLCYFILQGIFNIIKSVVFS